MWCEDTSVREISKTPGIKQIRYTLSRKEEEANGEPDKKPSYRSHKGYNVYFPYCPL